MNSIKLTVITAFTAFSLSIMAMPEEIQAQFMAGVAEAVESTATPATIQGVSEGTHYLSPTPAAGPVAASKSGQNPSNTPPVPTNQGYNPPDTMDSAESGDTIYDSGTESCPFSTALLNKFGRI